MGLNLSNGNMYKFVTILGIPSKANACTIAAIAI